MMAKKATKAAKPNPNPKPKPSPKPVSKPKPQKTKTTAERIAEPIKAAGKSIRDSASQAMQNTSTINTKVIDHAESNAREAFAAMRRVASAKSIQDVLKVQTDFVKDQSARTTTQVREVGEMIAGFGRDAMNMMRGK